MKYKAMYLIEKRNKEKLIHLIKESFVQGLVSNQTDSKLTWQEAWFQSPALRELKEMKLRGDK